MHLNPRPTQLFSAAHDRELGVTRLEFGKDSALGGSQAGQYCWLAMEGVDCEWHPFTISSAPASPTVTFHIKGMGEGTFTNKLSKGPYSIGEKKQCTNRIA